MRRLGLGLLVVATAAGVGCDLPWPKKKPTETTQAESSVAGSGGGANANAGGPGMAAVQGVRGAVQRAVTVNELKNLHLFIDTASLASGRMPTKAEISAAVQKEDKKLYEFLADGTIVLTGSTARESCWAYQKDSATNGGWIVTHTGPEQVDAATARRWITGQ